MQKAGGKRLFRDNKTLLSRPGPGAAWRLTGRHVHGGPILRHRSFKTAPDQVSRTSMPSKIRIALDAMGGDAGAAVVIPGAAVSLDRHGGTEFLLVGDRAKIEPELAKHPRLKAASKVIHTDVAVSGEDKPSQALRRGRKYRRTDGDVALQPAHIGGDRPPGDHRDMADQARRVRRARPRRHHRRRC